MRLFPTLGDRLRARATLIALAYVGVTGMGCDGDDDGNPHELACVELPAPDCAPLYEPVWDRVWADSLQPSCTASGASCHSNPNATGARVGGLLLSDADTAYSSLMEGGHLDGDDAACTNFLVRLLSPDPVVRMPPGTSLDEMEICSITQWVEAGAPR